MFMDFPGDSDAKESAFNAGDLCLIPGLGRSLGEGTPVFLPGEFHGQGILSLQSMGLQTDTTEQLSLTYVYMLLLFSI